MSSCPYLRKDPQDRYSLLYLKLANVSPVILALYAENKINFDQISALALTDDHELRERVWSTAPAYSRSGNNLRRMITENRSGYQQ